MSDHWTWACSTGMAYRFEMSVAHVSVLIFLHQITQAPGRAAGRCRGARRRAVTAVASSPTCPQAAPAQAAAIACRAPSRWPRSSSSCSSGLHGRRASCACSSSSSRSPGAWPAPGLGRFTAGKVARRRRRGSRRRHSRAAAAAAAAAMGAGTRHRHGGVCRHGLVQPPASQRPCCGARTRRLRRLQRKRMRRHGSPSSVLWTERGRTGRVFDVAAGFAEHRTVAGYNTAHQFYRRCAICNIMVRHSWSQTDMHPPLKGLETADCRFLFVALG